MRGGVAIRLTSQPRSDRLVESPAPVGVVGELVHRRRRRRQQHRVPRPRPRPRPARPRRASPLQCRRVRPRRRAVPGACRRNAATRAARSTPITTAARSRADVAATSSSTSTPLSSPPTIQTTEPKARSDASAACGLVAFESSIQRMPSGHRHGLDAVRVEAEVAERVARSPRPGRRTSGRGRRRRACSATTCGAAEPGGVRARSTVIDLDARRCGAPRGRPGRRGCPRRCRSRSGPARRARSRWRARPPRPRRPRPCASVASSALL